MSLELPRRNLFKIHNGIDAITGKARKNIFFNPKQSEQKLKRKIKEKTSESREKIGRSGGTNSPEERELVIKEEDGDSSGSEHNGLRLEQRKTYDKIGNGIMTIVETHSSSPGRLNSDASENNATAKKKQMFSSRTISNITKVFGEQA